MKKALFVMTATVLLWIAQISAVSACVVHIYEPDLPERLQ